MTHPSRPIRSRKHSTTVQGKFNKSLLALATLAIPFSGYVQAAASETTLPEVRVRAEADVPYKADESANTKLTQPLLNTPQTVQVIRKEILLEQGSTSLVEALRNTPGVTMQLGENGNTSAGDTLQMRGFSVSTSTFVDGIRDLGAVTRDVFNLEQIEISKGPAGTDVGRGSASGYLNLISKLPTRNSATTATAGYGTADRKRAAVDIGENFGETGAVRFNALFADGGVPKRDQVSNENYSIAPSIALGLGTSTRYYLFSQHVKQDNVPDGGLPALGYGYAVLPYFDTTNATTQVTTRTDNAATRALAAAINSAPAVDRSNFYGYRGDSEEVSADMITFKVEHNLGANTVVRNVSRFGQTNMDRTLSGVNSPAVSANTTNPANAAYLNPNDLASWTFSPSRQGLDRTDEILANQTSFNSELDAGGLHQSLTGGLEFMRESQKSLTLGNAAATINGVVYAAPVNPPTRFYSPDSDIFRGQLYLNGAFTDGETKTAALYLSDTLELNPQWLLSGGLRYERYTTTTEGAAITNNLLTASPELEDKDNLLSWKVGAVYKPVDSGSIYASYATSQTPPGSANFVLSGADNNQNNSALDPQETDNIELGTKWALFDNQLNLAAAIFRTENDKQASFDDLGNPLQIGRTRVEGVEISAVGQLTNFWQVSAGVTHLDAEALDQQSSTGVETTGVRWNPELSATLWTSYTFGDLTVGGGARYVSEQERIITVVTAPQTGASEIPSFWSSDMMVAYKATPQLNLRLNLYNLTDEEYVETLNNGGNRVRLGTPRSMMLTAEFSF